MTQADEKAACCAAFPYTFAWVLDNIRQIKPFPVEGKLGLFEVTPPDEGSKE
jgi:hypothetical protein